MKKKNDLGITPGEISTIFVNNISLQSSYELLLKVLSERALRISEVLKLLK